MGGVKLALRSGNRLPFPSETTYIANVLPMETTDFVCVQNPVLVYLYFLKEYTADFILKNLEYLESYFLKTTDCVYKN